MEGEGNELKMGPATRQDYVSCCWQVLQRRRRERERKKMRKGREERGGEVEKGRAREIDKQKARARGIHQMFNNISIKLE